jgi:ABC-2 type transport system permease protein
MGNMLNIARKEFADLFNNWTVLLILAFYLLLAVKLITGFKESVDILNSPPDPSRVLIGNGNLSASMLISLFSLLAQYGLLVGVVLGVSLIATERKAGALNTLIVKPLYRDTIINGKLLAATGFLACLFGLTTALYTSAIMLLYGDSISSVLPAYLERMPVVLLLSIVYVMIFLILSMLISIIVKSQAFALILSVLLTYVSQTINSWSFAGFLSTIISGRPDESLRAMIASMSPDSLMSANNSFFRTLVDPTNSMMSVIASYEADIIRLLVFLVISVVLCYIVFIRSDIA